MRRIAKPPLRSFARLPGCVVFADLLGSSVSQ
jgi:hypothetical protein